MAPSRPLLKLPKDKKTWASHIKKHRRSLPESDPSKVSLDNLEQKLKSASKLQFPDWLLLKALLVEEQRRPTPINLLGEKVGSSLEQECRSHLEGKPWWSALESKDKDPDSWLLMGMWKLSQLEIENVAEMIPNKPSTGDLEDSSDLDQAFDTQRLYIEPEGDADDDDEVTEPNEPRRLTAQQGQEQRRSEHAKDKQTAIDCGLSSSPEADSPGDENDLYQQIPSPESTSDGSTMSDDTRARSRDPPYETLVNAALGLLLQGISFKHPDVAGKFKWTTIQRRFEVSQLRCKDNKVKRKKIMTAKVDGCLQVVEPGKRPDHGDSLCILEVKPVRRAAKPVNISMQEAAEMAAWISSEHELGLLPSFQSDAAGHNIKRRFLISQHLDEIWITVAEYDEQYIRYIANRSHPESSETQSNNQRGQKRGRREMRGAREQGEKDEESDQERGEKQQKLEEAVVDNLNDEGDP